MRLWLSRKSPVSMREQIATQMMLGVISEDLKPGQRVPERARAGAESSDPRQHGERRVSRFGTARLA
jgi:hypothetical protein